MTNEVCVLLRFSEALGQPDDCLRRCAKLTGDGKLRVLIALDAGAPTELELAAETGAVAPDDLRRQATRLVFGQLTRLGIDAELDVQLGSFAEVATSADGAACVGVPAHRHRLVHDDVDLLLRRGHSVLIVPAHDQRGVT